MTPSILIYADCDGVITTPLKYFDGVRFSKAFSDHDAYAISLLKPWLVLISQDPTNAAWAAHKGVEFVHVNGTTSWDKYIALCSDWAQRVREGKVTVDGLAPFSPDDRYIYVGDSLYDLDCLKHARYGFIPSDGSNLLRHQVAENAAIEVLDTSGGHGCLEEVLYKMIFKLWDDLSPHFRPIHETVRKLMEYR